MDLSLASIQIAMLALPGILWASLDATTSHRLKNTSARFWIRVFLFGVFTYALLALIYNARGVEFDAFKLEGAAKEVFSAKADEIVWSVPLSFALALIWIAGKTHAVLPRLLRKLRISDSSGCEDIWEYALSKQSPVGNWVHVRDFEKGAIYEGWVKAYSDGPEIRELLLAHVSVYGLDGVRAYDQHALYISRPADNMNLEFCLEKGNE